MFNSHSIPSGSRLKKKKRRVHKRQKLTYLIRHNIYLFEQNKLSSDDKRFLTKSTTKTLPWSHYQIESLRSTLPTEEFQLVEYVSLANILIIQIDPI